ncbi:MAG: imidazole glycerol phosphate synthase subunit HisH [Candidatus Peribacteraceae bacterium]|nr:imidazole glycerol phosphate synthase subunit HisH [Candidatus Peribacteraceae bacterium]
MIGILRYNAGNTGSVQRALARLNIASKIIESPTDLESVSGMIFPGAGAAGSAMNRLTELGWTEAIQSYTKPFLGLCLGMQLLFESSEENDTECLGVIKGNVRELSDELTKPHMGWNKLSTGEYAYFVHSFVCEPTDASVFTMSTRYGTELCAGVQQRNFFGVQWHPEKSGDAGDRYLLSFSKLCK